MRKPYIGVCDLVSPEQTIELLKYIPTDFSHQLMVGVMMSRKTLFGLPTKWADIFPKKETIKDIFVADPRVLNTIHYADYGTGGDADEMLPRTLLLVEHFGGPNLDAIQLDMIWPDPEDIVLYRRACRGWLRHTKDSRKDILIVLQVGENAMEKCGNDPLLVCERLKAYGDSIDYVLFDKSMGRGKGMDAELLSHYVGALVADCPTLLPAVAGGLGPTTMHLVRPLARGYSQLSWDAQGRLRPSHSLMTPLDMGYASAYVRGSVSLIERGA